MKFSTQPFKQGIRGRLRFHAGISLLLLLPVFANAQEPFIGEIRMFGGNFAPRGWAFCDGQLLPIAQNTALFSLLGTMYGGDGRTTFGLPDLRGRFPMHPGTGPGLSPRTQGEKDGAEQVTLTLAQIPAHTHSAEVAADSTIGASDQPRGALPARNASATPGYGTDPNVRMDSAMVRLAPAGGGQPHNNMPPFHTVNFIIALQGIFPSRN
jgi:microcystin-dependent protein